MYSHQNFSDICVGHIRRMSHASNPSVRLAVHVKSMKIPWRQQKTFVRLIKITIKINKFKENNINIKIPSKILNIDIKVNDIESVL
jgi:hypothetical protein